MPISGAGSSLVNPLVQQFIPAVGSAERGRVYQWSVFAIAELEKVAFPWNRARRSNEDETEAAEKFAPVGEAVRAALTDPWIAGDDFTVADILIASVLRNTVELGLLEPADPVCAYVERAIARPAQLRADAAGAKPS